MTHQKIHARAVAMSSYNQKSTEMQEFGNMGVITSEFYSGQL